MITMDHVTVIHGDTVALSDVTVDFPASTSTVVMGPSGCGKSTLLKVAAGLIPPDRGRVCFRGSDVFTMTVRAEREFRRANGFVFQDGALWENKTVAENLALPLEVHFENLHPSEVERRVQHALERVGLAAVASHRPASLSSGERKIASLLRALITEPSVVFLDEPTLSIDHSMGDRIRQMIHELKARGCTIIAVTEDPRLASTLADRLVVLDAGLLLEAGDFDQVKRSRNARARSILSQVLGEIASYDTDLLGLLEGEDSLPEN